MDIHSTTEPARPSRPWFPLLLILASVLTAGLLCGDALARLAPDAPEADTEVRPDVALVLDPAQVVGGSTRDPLPVDEVAWGVQPPAGEGQTTPPADATPTEDTVVATPVSEQPSGSNGNANPNADPNGHTNNAHNGNGHNGNGHQHGKP
jgi:hypothetical protein